MYRILGIDYGEKRIGLALSDPLLMIASPYKTLPNNSDLLTDLKSIMDSENIKYVVVGWPKGMKGQITKQTEYVQAFVDLLKGEGIIVELVDERLTSVSAEKALRDQGIKTGHHKGLVDQTAAALILQQFLDTQK